MKKIDLYKKYNKEKVEKILYHVKRIGAKFLRDKLKIKIILKKGGYYSSILANQYTITDYILENKINVQKLIWQN